MIYHYGVVEKALTAPVASDWLNVDMENLDYKRQPKLATLRAAVEASGGSLCGIWRGGLFGLATNQVAVLSEWSTQEAAQALRLGNDAESTTLCDECVLQPTVRPLEPLHLHMPGFYVLRWLRMRRQDVADYTNLCLATWPAFEAAGNAYCYAVFQECTTNDDVVKLLMVTWYDSMQAWEDTRQLAPRDKDKWARRSTMELVHWGHAARLVVD